MSTVFPRMYNLFLVSFTCKKEGSFEQEFPKGVSDVRDGVDTYRLILRCTTLEIFLHHFIVS